MNIEKNFDKITKQAKGLEDEINKLVPFAMVKETTAFGNSSHIILSKNFRNKKVGIIVLGDIEKK